MDNKSGRDKLGQSFDGLIGDAAWSDKDKKNEGIELRKRYFVHDVFIVIKEWFLGKSVTKRSRETFSDTAESLIAQITQDNKDGNNSGMLEASKKLLEQHRMIEDTRARRRLERWATRVISWYLILVFLLIIANSVVTKVTGSDFITGGIMGAILTTTTINIIGLGLIVLKGHFPNKGKDNVK